LAQPSLSTQIHLLEEDVGVQLLHFIGIACEVGKGVGDANGPTAG
jgi:hypothetical protein